MIASRTGLYLLSANAAAAVLLVALDRPSPPPDTRLFTAEPHAIEGPGFALVDDKWRTPPGDVEPGARDAMRTAIRAARWHRRAEVEVGAPYDAALHLDALEVRRGRRVEGTGQGWLAVGGTAYLVDVWVIDALFPPPLALRITHPLDVPGAWRIGDRDFDGARFDGNRISAAARAQLAAALDALAITGVPSGDTGAPARLLEVARGSRFFALTATPCGAGRLALATTGAGCTDPAVWEQLRTLVARFAIDTPFDPRPLDAPAADATLVDGRTLPLAKLPAGLDPAKVDAFRRALAAPGTLLTTDARAVGALRVGDTHFTVYADGAIRREHEAVRIAVPPVLLQPLSAFRDPRLWAEDPSTIHAIELDGARYTRGQAIGDWDHGDGAILEQLAAALAQASQASQAAEPGSAAHRLKILVDRPDGSHAEHELVLDARCNGDAALCALLSRASG